MDWSKTLSKQVMDMPRSGIREFFDLATGSKDIISLGVGEQDFVTPWNIREAAIRSLERGHTTYTSNYGLESLRRAGATIAGEETQLTRQITKQDLMELGLSGGKDSSLLRRKLLLRLRLPEHMSANAMLQALNVLFSLEELEQMLKQLPGCGEKV